MIQYYFVLFIRNLKRQKLFSFINLLGLTVSMVSTLLIYMYVRHEFSYDRFHNHAERIYRVNQTFIWGENNDHEFASTGPGVANALHEALPEVELITSIHAPGNFIVSYSSPSKEVITFEEDKILAVDSNFFSMFNFPVVEGDRQSPLILTNTVVMTNSTAKKYFGSENPIGKLVQLSGLKGDKKNTFEVTAVVDDTPANSYIQFNMLVSMNSFPEVKRLHWSWIWTQLETFVRLNEHGNISDTRAKLAGIPRRYAEESLQRIMNTSYDDYIKSGKKWELFLQPLTRIHLPAEAVLNRLQDNAGNIKIIYSLVGAALFILLLSCVNFMNLSTAQFTRRIKEASIRKILGLGRKELSVNYFIEALLFCAIALLLALSLTQLALPAFNFIAGQSLHINLLHDHQLTAAMLAMVFFMALVSSAYPAFFLSSFHPVDAIKGKLKSGNEGRVFRNGLVVFQFSVSIILILCTATVFQQLNYFSSKDIGFDKENLLIVSHVESLKDKESFAAATRDIPGVTTDSWCSSVPPNLYGGDKFTADGLNNKTFSINFTTGDENYIPALGIELIVGRNFSTNAPADVNRVILNETCVKNLGWKVDETIIGKKIQIPGGEVTFEVIGVVGDFHYWSLETPIEPMAIFHIKNKNVFGQGDKEFLALRIASQNSDAWQTTMDRLSKLWKVHAGDTPFQYTFMDQSFAETFKTQQQFGKILIVMASLAILIACLGLLGIIIYTLERRSKEIGIRKVSGASVWDILKLIAKGYTKLIVLAFVIGAPLAYWIMQHWLEDFAYRITPSPWVFVGVGLGTLIVAIMITSYHAVKAALTNPVDVLKDE